MAVLPNWLVLPAIIPVTSTSKTQTYNSWSQVDQGRV